MKFTIKKEHGQAQLGIPNLEFPKYTTQIMNLANSNAGGTRPKVVGQMSDLIVQAAAANLDEWRDFYTRTRPDSIAAAANKVSGMLANLRIAFELIDDSMVERWVHDLVIHKTYYGFKVQDVVLLELSRRFACSVRVASASDEAKGIDGYLGDVPVQIKPHTYRSKSALSEQIDCAVVFYEKKSAGISVDASALSAVL
jgi:hypothetical protein